MPDERPIDVTVVLFDGGYSSTAVAPLEVFHAAGLLWQMLRGEPERPRFRVRSASVDGRPVTSTYGLGLTPQCAIDQVKGSDVILLTSPHQNACEGIVRKTSLVPWLRAAFERGTLIGGVCSGVAFVAESGLLDGRRATTHWALAETYRERYPRVSWQPEHFVTEDDGIVCSGGMYASIDLSLYLVEKLCGHDIALQCAKSLVVSLPRNLQSGYGVVPLSRTHADERVKQAEQLLQRAFDRNDVSVEQIAEQLAMSPRNLLRRFKAATGHLPGEYVHLLRVATARDLLESGGAPVQKVAAAVGYEDLASFRQIFKRHTGMTPADYRSRFGPLTVAHPELATAEAASAASERRGRALG
jgi:transcriptional regulator GlxA family with amidase domain